MLAVMIRNQVKPWAFWASSQINLYEVNLMPKLLKDPLTAIVGDQGSMNCEDQAVVKLLIEPTECNYPDEKLGQRNALRYFLSYVTKKN